jgi:hypothetical protein
MDIPARRLASHGISAPHRAGVAQLVQRLGAVQAQEFPFAKWGIGLRLRGVFDDDVERAFAEGEILRTHVLRPTWHFVTAEDIGWMLDLTAPRVHVALRSYMQREGLDARLMRRVLAIFSTALEGRQYLTRAELGARLRRRRIDLNAIQLGFATLYAELERVICSGPRRDKAFTYALLAERAPGGRRIAGDEALGTLASRFFSSHGPATVRDFVWWSGLRTSDARRGAEIAQLQRIERNGLCYWVSGERPIRVKASGVHLLPIYDEYLVAYRDRVAVPHTIGGSGQAVAFRHALVIDGQVAGTWTLARAAAPGNVRITPLRPLTSDERELARRSALRLASFLRTPLRIEVNS